MNDALKRFTPDSNWISAGLLTLLVVSFGIFAEKKVGPHAQPVELNLVTQMCECDESQRGSRVLSTIRFH